MDGYNNNILILHHIQICCVFHNLGASISALLPAFSLLWWQTKIGIEGSRRKDGEETEGKRIDRTEKECKVVIEKSACKKKITGERDGKAKEEAKSKGQAVPTSTLSL